MVTRKIQHAAFAAFTLAALLPFSDPALSFWNARMDVLTPAPAPPVPMRLYEPPARRAILVDADGLAQKTADGIWMTKRDRSRVLIEDRRETRRGIPVYVHPEPSPVLTRGDGSAEYTAAERRIDVTEPAEAPVSDEVLAARVREAVTAEEALYIAALNVRIEASAGVITLAGRVNSEAERLEILEKARQTSGVAGVNDRLETAAL